MAKTWTVKQQVKILETKENDFKNVTKRFGKKLNQKYGLTGKKIFDAACVANAIQDQICWILTMLAKIVGGKLQEKIISQVIFDNECWAALWRK